MKYTALAVKVKTGLQGYWLAAAAICTPERAAEVERAFSAMEKTELFWPEDPIELDLRLAELIGRYCPPGVPAAAAVLAAAGREASTGGVIGSPRHQPRSAYGGLEELAEDLTLWSRPGGPGFVFAGSSDRAGELRDRFLDRERQNLQLNPDERYELFTRCLQEDPPDAWLYAADGSGREQRGILAAGSGREITLIKL
ncbi:MAG: hypothetical protein VB085_10855 [Peptococcaceae bacterium]|nr:hypothetical protein [Peptococcaceae bacterium]